MTQVLSFPLPRGREVDSNTTGHSYPATAGHQPVTWTTILHHLEILRELLLSLVLTHPDTCSFVHASTQRIHPQCIYFKTNPCKNYHLTKKHISELLDLGLKVSLDVNGDWDYIAMNSIVHNIICGISLICL